MRHSIMITATFMALAACSAPINRLNTVPVTSDLSVNPAVSSLMIRSVSLPSYAAAEEVAFQSPEGLIATAPDVLWADEPERAVTLQITRHLNDIMGITVGPDPWPFASLPDVAVEIRVEDMLARADGTFQFRGQYFLGGDGIDYRNASYNFDLTEPLIGEGLTGLAQARAAAVLKLSEAIARKLAR